MQGAAILSHDTRYRDKILQIILQVSSYNEIEFIIHISQGPMGSGNLSIYFFTHFLTVFVHFKAILTFSNKHMYFEIYTLRKVTNRVKEIKK